MFPNFWLKNNSCFTLACARWVTLLENPEGITNKPLVPSVLFALRVAFGWWRWESHRANLDWLISLHRLHYQTEIRGPWLSTWPTKKLLNLMPPPPEQLHFTAEAHICWVGFTSVGSLLIFLVPTCSRMLPNSLSCKVTYSRKSKMDHKNTDFILVKNIIYSSQLIIWII